MKKLLLGTMALIGLLSAGVAQAADMPVKAAPVAAPPPFSWSGFYIGAHVGAGWGTVESSITSVEIDRVKMIMDGTDTFSIPFTSHTINGFLGGGQIGWNWQSGWFVFGIEGQFSGSDIDGSTPCATFVVNLARCSANVNWVATAAARFGVAIDRAMIYVKGGGAWADTEYSAAGIGGSFTTTASDTRSGWMVGAGVEYAFAPNWSAKIEYNFMDFGSDNLAFPILDRRGNQFATVNADIDQKLHLIKFGLNYRFGWGAPAPVAARY
jgi:outer membrane immunogenic protein